MSDDERSTEREAGLSRRELLATAGTAAAGLSLLSAGGALGAGDKGKLIGWSQSNRGVALWNNVAIPAFVKEAKAKGYKVTVLDAKDNPSQQAANFENLLTLGVASMVML